MFKRMALMLVLVGPWLFSAEGTPRVPTIEDLLNLKSVGGARISPDGKWVAYTLTETDFKQDAYVTQIWLANTSSGDSFQLTRGDKSSTSPEWSSDGKWLAFTSTRAGDKNQIFVIAPNGGEAMQLTKSESGVNSFAWSSDAKSIAFTAPEPVSQQMKDRKEHLGDYEVARRDYNFTHIWTFDVAEGMKTPVAGKQRTKGKDFNVGAIS